MTIATFDQWIASAKQFIPWARTASRVTVSTRWFAIHDLAGTPGAATLAAGSSVSGVVPTDATSGFPPIVAASGTVYLSTVDFSSTVACRLMIYDRLFHAGAYNFNDAVTLSSQPSFGARIPGSNYAGTQIWFEAITAFTGSFNLAVTYTNQASTAGRTTGTIVIGAATAGAMFQLPLQAGDTGVQKIESVTGTVASVGTFNIVVIRQLWNGRIAAGNGGDCHGPDRTGMPIMFGDSALCVATAPDSTSSGLPELQMVVVNG